jgi:hypothetical protein
LPWPVVLLSSLIFIALASNAQAASIINGGFETGTLEGWHAEQQTPFGEWEAWTPMEPEEEGGIFRPFEGTRGRS